MKRRTCLALPLLGLPLAAPAGAVFGPYVVWMNLAEGSAAAAVDSAMREVFADPRPCWREGALFYVDTRPQAITPALVRRALLQRDAQAQHRLRAELNKPFGEVSSFDGLVAYTDRPRPRLVSLAVGGRLKSETLRSRSGEMAWAATFCNVLPPISRRP
jgi:hypothetical protein